MLIAAGKSTGYDTISGNHGFDVRCIRAPAGERQLYSPPFGMDMKTADALSPARHEDIDLELLMMKQECPPRDISVFSQHEYIGDQSHSALKVLISE